MYSMHSFFEQGNKSPSALEMKQNAQWRRDDINYNNLPDDLYLSYIFVDKKISFCINGGHERKNIITFQVEDKNVYDEFSLSLASKEMNIKDVSNDILLGNKYAFDLEYSSASDVKLFINELDVRFPFPKEIKQTLFTAAESLGQESKNKRNDNVMNSEAVIEKVERLKRKANKLLDSITTLQEELEEASADNQLTNFRM
ncbi:hypothetical protein ACQUW5_00655 [Legionella sp. CNM-1927-20]|uniref:hypothetical protein n=1 Tax=Legionella sp. CNM-1927-20 TaxID=3422221 RepID=UPI00403AEE66